MQIHGIPLQFREKEVCWINYCLPFSSLQKIFSLNLIIKQADQSYKLKKKDYNKTLANRFPSDHYPSSKYENDYGTQNIMAIKHLLDSDNRTMTSYWTTYLRGEKKKKFLKDDIIKREKKLRNKSNERNYAGKQ